jgi:hypothetical protein
VRTLTSAVNRCPVMPAVTGGWAEGNSASGRHSVGARLTNPSEVSSSAVPKRR